MKNRIEPEQVCPDHVDMFIELVECNDCTIYPQDQINVQIKDAEERGYKRGLRKATDIARMIKSSNKIEKTMTGIIVDAIDKYRWML